MDANAELNFPDRAAPRPLRRIDGVGSWESNGPLINKSHSCPSLSVPPLLSLFPGFATEFNEFDFLSSKLQLHIHPMLRPFLEAESLSASIPFVATASVKPPLSFPVQFLRSRESLASE